MIRLLALIVIPLVIFFNLRADAENDMETGAAAETAGRYVMQETDGGYLRMDTATGYVSFCRRGARDWVCEAVGDDMAAIESEMSRLVQENAALHARVEELERELAPVPPREVGPRSKDMPDEEELDRVMSYMERMMQRFVEMMKRLSDEDGGKRI